MEKEFETFNSLNEETFINELDALDEDARREKILETVRKHNEFGDKNRQLFERAKKSEGELKELKAKADETDKEPKTKPKKSDEELLKRLDKLALKTSGISEADEVELYEKWKTDTGRDSDSIVENSIFQKELGELRTAKANLNATSNMKGDTGVSGAKSDPDYWINKATPGADGKLMFPEETPKELFSKIVEKLAGKDSSTSEGLKFYNQK